MKYSKLLLFFFLVSGFVACDKVKDLPSYGAGTAVTLSSSVAAVAPAAVDSLKPALTLSWTNPSHATDSSNYKFVIEIDSSTKNFSKPSTITVMAARSYTFIAKDLNNILLSYGYAFNVPVDMDVRVTSSYGNNNERITSNTLKLRMTPYKIPPKVALPTTSRIFITGDASDFGWTNPAPMPAIRELTRMNETTWAGIFHLSGGGGFLLLPEAGNWNIKFAINNPATADAGTFGLHDANNPGFNDNFSGSVTGGAGWYKVVLDFQQGKYTITKQVNALGADLWITGDATVGGWVNNPPAPQKFTMISSGLFEITQAFVPGKAYKFLNSSGNWQPQFGGPSATGGDMFANYGGGNDPANIPSPATAGTYKVRVNFLTGTGTAVGTYSVGP